MTPAFASVIVHQQGAESDIGPDIGFDHGCIPVFHGSRNIVRKVAAIKQVKEHLEVLIGRQVILEEHAKSDPAVCGSAQPTYIKTGTVRYHLVRCLSGDEFSRRIFIPVIILN